MKDLFLTNYSDLSFLDRIKDCFKKCNSFTLSVSFIKKAGLVLFQREIEEALERGAKGRIITSTYQNFTDIASLKEFLAWQNKYDNFECHLDMNCFGENGFHSKGYLFEYDDSIEIIVGSSNITRFALLKNIEWNISLISKNNIKSYDEAIKNFEYLWDRTLKLSEDVIKQYNFVLEYAIEKWDMDYINPLTQNIVPNSMQRKALKELTRYRDTGVKRALIISATGSGKTYLAAFDARNFDAKRVLFVVHRETILKDAKQTFMNVFGAEKTCGLYTGNSKDLDCDYVFASSNMLARHLTEFDKNEFDYICYDEVHHIVAECGKKILNYFNPEFLLGLTATPERMDNQDIFELFEQNVPFELRLRDAINNDLVVPFHYYGIRDDLINYGEDDKNKVSKNIAESDNIDFIAKEIEKHRLPNEKLKAVAFCTNIAHCSLMANELAMRGYSTAALTGENNTGERIKAFNDLQDETNDLEIICTVDILNEGVDIPAINTVLFLRPTESSTIFLQQLGRGLRKYQNKQYLTVLDFIGNDYSRSVQIALALGTLGKTTYTEKAYLKNLIESDYKTLNIPGVEIHIDELSKKEIVKFIDQENFNKKSFLKKDYENFKKYLNKDSIPTHMDYLESEIAPDLNRFIKSKIGGKRIRSYYEFLTMIGEENLPIFTEEEIKLIDSIEELLPIVRLDEFLIINYLLHHNEINIDKIVGYNSRVTNETLNNAIQFLTNKEVLINNQLSVDNISNIKDYLEDLINYGINRYEIEFGDFEGKYKLYANYSKEQTMTSINRKYTMDILLKGTYFDTETGDTYVYVGLKKDKAKQERTDYKDKFISPSIIQWESENNVTIDNSIGLKLKNTKNIYVFVRKMDVEDNIILPFTYFGTGKFTNMKESHVKDQKTGDSYKTLLFDIQLDNTVPEEYFVDFEIPNEIK
ncbi:dEAD/DEAH box helicase [Mycoplasma sp. CAG:472]|nr:dEAD/DEAH box helicase [Mycoplasma sp. CAG:472]